jgi:hypothetical protein
LRYYPARAERELEVRIASVLADSNREFPYTIQERYRYTNLLGALSVGVNTAAAKRVETPTGLVYITVLS